MTNQPETAVTVDALARMLSAADVEINHGDYPTWDTLAESGQKQYRQAARYLLKRLHITAPAAVSAAVAPPTNRAAVLREAADRIDNEELPHDYVDMFDNGARWAARLLRRMADETATETPTAVDLPTLAAALDGLHTLIATSSRDWGTYRVDAWLWAVLCGWDCEQTEHDDTCVHGALEETAARHGWDEATIAKARRYRAAVRAVTEHQPADETATETPAPDDRNAGPGWYEVITSPQATTCIAYVHEDGSLYLPEGDLTEEEFAFAAARGKAHRLVRADEQPAAGARQDGAES